jgi:hypothetical protein
MKRIFILIPLIACLLSLSACQDERNNYMVNDKIGLLNPNLIEAKVYNGINANYNLYVIKSGKGQQNTQVSISVEDSVLKNYNSANGTNYVQLPENCYTITSKTLSFGKEDYCKAFEINWNIQSLTSLLASKNNYALPVHLNIDNSSITPGIDRMSTLILPEILEPYIGFSNSGLSSVSYMPTINDLDEEEIYVKVKTNFNNSSDISYQIAVDKQLITDYNNANGTNYLLLPDNAYELEKTTWTIPSNVNAAYFKIKFKKKGLIPDTLNYAFGNYVIPIKLVSVSKDKIDPQASTMLYPVIFQPDKIDKTSWKVIDYNCSNKQDEVGWIAALDWGPEKMLDNNTATFWGSVWTTPKKLPYYFVFDMGKQHKLFKLGFENPSGDDAWRGDAKAGYIEVSIDNKTWTHLQDWTAPDKDTRTVTFSVPTTTARYIRFVITDAFTLVNGGSQMNIAEFNAWGL